MKPRVSHPHHRRRPLFAFVLLTCALIACTARDTARGPAGDTVVVESQRIGQRLPRLTVATFSPDSATIGGTVPQPVTLVNLWATFCGPCIAELPALVALQQRYAARGLRVLAVSEDRGDAEVKAFILRHPLSLPIGRDPTGIITAALANTTLPQNVLLAADGRVLYRTYGLGPDLPALDTAIDAALAVR